MLDLIVLREKGYKRDIKLLQMLMFVKSTVWKNLFGKEAEKLERSNDEPWKCKGKFFGTISPKIVVFPIFSSDFIIEKEPLVNNFISLPKDKSSLNCAAFTAGIIEVILTVCEFDFYFIIYV